MTELVHSPAVLSAAFLLLLTIYLTCKKGKQSKNKLGFRLGEHHPQLKIQSFLYIPNELVSKSEMQLVSAIELGQ